MNQRLFKKASVLTLTAALIACSSAPKESAPTVSLSPSVSVTLPQPSELGYSLTASQLISATWQADRTSKSEQLPVHLQVNQDKVVLAGFSSWGTRILSLEYQASSITTDVLAGLEGSLPKPEQVLFNLMITLWPSSAWEGPLNEVRWRVIDTENSRAVFDNHGQQVIDIRYSQSDKLAGDIEFHNLTSDYAITIKTLQYNQAP
ncbi:hypothetical protein VISI1226_12691 [Vibrio sinaloensis DSM 21326]|uniref:Lipoprotein n=1 Tax=Vibrio sinaloensis DSM 21326 TaxID=945550 RepID=E8M2Y5_PHOS4|nr:DUF3261 domain-containing protein [Vibrio sinaloensis]EGA71643.1 hypothetical protein VISI1226_12691 [Vibrio sinaloensis DSM 21326]